MIGNDIAAALPELRAEADSLMVGTCDIERATTGWDEGLKKSVTTWAPVHMGVPCAFVESPATSRTLLTDQAVTQAGPQVKIPVAFDEVKSDDRVTVTGVGVVWVTHAPKRDNQVQIRLECRWAR